MALYRGRLVQLTDDATIESVVVSGLCCATPFQVMTLNYAWFESKKLTAQTSAMNRVRVSVQAVTGELDIADNGVLAVWDSVGAGGFLGSEHTSDRLILLPFQSTKGEIIVRLTSTNTSEANEVAYVLDVAFATLKELDYMRLVTAGL